jgi:hypothetical protein
MARWITFEARGFSKSGATKAWDVLSTSMIAVLLGKVRWYGPWRKYSFFPNRNADLVFEKDCLRDIADFCETETKNHRSARVLESKKEPK